MARPWCGVIALFISHLFFISKMPMPYIGLGAFSMPSICPRGVSRQTVDHPFAGVIVMEIVSRSIGILVAAVFALMVGTGVVYGFHHPEFYVPMVDVPAAS
jgi:hypothetical protein